MSARSTSLALSFAVLLAIPSLASNAFAQFAPPRPGQADMTIDAATRAQVVDTLCAAIEARYVFPEVAKKVTRAIRAREKAGDFARISSAEAFADTLTGLLRAVGKDRHFRVGYREEALPRANQQQAPDSAEARRDAEFWRRRNYGFEKVSRLPGNVGYLDLRAFNGSREAGVTATSAMTFLANCDALIIDLRRNGGGHPDMIALLLSYLVAGDERIHFNDFYERREERTLQYWTLPNLPGPRLTGIPLYVLTSHRTGSAAEEFAYDIQNLKRGTLVGEVTVGAANPGEFVRLSDHFAAFISDGRAVNPVTHTNWEGVGVKPEVATSVDEALKTAHVSALEGLLGKATDVERREGLQAALEDVKSAPVEPLDPRAAGARAPGR